MDEHEGPAQQHLRRLQAEHRREARQAERNKVLGLGAAACVVAAIGAWLVWKRSGLERDTAQRAVT